MSHTYSSIFFHIVWSTKDRTPIIETNLEKRLHSYMGGVIKNEKCDPIIIGGTPDHVHLLVRIPARYSIADLVRRIKTNSSKFINQLYPRMRFLWQEGYGAFSVSTSKINIVKNYILKQKIHHKKNSFLDEFIKLLNKHEIEYDKKYLFK